MLGIIKRNFTYISRKCFIILYKSLVRSHLEYANSVWYPKRTMDVEKLERVQKRATKCTAASIIFIEVAIVTTSRKNSQCLYLFPVYVNSVV